MATYRAAIFTPIKLLCLYDFKQGALRKSAAQILHKTKNKVTAQLHTQYWRLGVTNK